MEEAQAPSRTIPLVGTLPQTPQAPLVASESLEESPRSLSVRDDTIDSRASPIPSDEVVDMASPIFEYYEEIKFKQPIEFGETQDLDQELSQKNKELVGMLETRESQTGKSLIEELPNLQVGTVERREVRIGESLPKPGDIQPSETETVILVKTTRRRIVSKTQRIIRKIVVVNGVETVVEETIEEPQTTGITEIDGQEVVQFEEVLADDEVPKYGIALESEGYSSDVRPVEFIEEVSDPTVYLNIQTADAGLDSLSVSDIDSRTKSLESGYEPEEKSSVAEVGEEELEHGGARKKKGGKKRRKPKKDERGYEGMSFGAIRRDRDDSPSEVDESKTVTSEVKTPIVTSPESGVKVAEPEGAVLKTTQALDPLKLSTVEAEVVKPEGAQDKPLKVDKSQVITIGECTTPEKLSEPTVTARHVSVVKEAPEISPVKMIAVESASPKSIQKDQEILIKTRTPIREDRETKTSSIVGDVPHSSKEVSEASYKKIVKPVEISDSASEITQSARKGPEKETILAGSIDEIIISEETEKKQKSSSEAVHNLPLTEKLHEQISHQVDVKEVPDTVEKVGSTLVESTQQMEVKISESMPKTPKEADTVEKEAIIVESEQRLEVKSPEHEEEKPKETIETPERKTETVATVVSKPLKKTKHTTKEHFPEEQIREVEVLQLEKLPESTETVDILPSRQLTSESVIKIAAQEPVEKLRTLDKTDKKAQEEIVLKTAEPTKSELVFEEVPVETLPDKKKEDVKTGTLIQVTDLDEPDNTELIEEHLTLDPIPHLVLPSPITHKTTPEIAEEVKGSDIQEAVEKIMHDRTLEVTDLDEPYGEATAEVKTDLVVVSPEEVPEFSSGQTDTRKPSKRNKKKNKKEFRKEQSPALSKKVEQPISKPELVVENVVQSEVTKIPETTPLKEIVLEKMPVREEKEGKEEIAVGKSFEQPKSADKTEISDSIKEEVKTLSGLDEKPVKRETPKRLDEPEFAEQTLSDTSADVTSAVLSEDIVIRSPVVTENISIQREIPLATPKEPITVTNIHSLEVTTTPCESPPVDNLKPGPVETLESPANVVVAPVDAQKLGPLSSTAPPKELKNVHIVAEPKVESLVDVPAEVDVDVETPVYLNKVDLEPVGLFQATEEVLPKQDVYSQTQNELRTLSVQTSPRLEGGGGDVVEGAVQTEFTGIDTTSQTNGIKLNQEIGSQTTPSLLETKESGDQTKKSEAEKYQQTSKTQSPVSKSPPELVENPTIEAESQTALKTSEGSSQTTQKTKKVKPVKTSTSESSDSKSGAEVVVRTEVPPQSSSREEEPIEVVVQTRVTLTDTETKKGKRAGKRKWKDDEKDVGPIVVVDTKISGGRGDEVVKTEVNIDSSKFLEEERKLSIASGSVASDVSLGSIEGVKETSTNIPTPPLIADHSPGPPDDAVVQELPPSMTTELDQQLDITSDLLTDRIVNVKGSKNNTPTADALFVATREDEPNSDSIASIEPLLRELDASIKGGDELAVQRILILTVETISDTLESIEYRIVLSRRKGSEERADDLSSVMRDMAIIEDSVERLGISVAKADAFGDSKDRVLKCLRSLEGQVAEVKAAAENEEDEAQKELGRWEEFLNGVNNVSVHVAETRSQLDRVLDSEGSTHSKLEELERIEFGNRALAEESSKLLIQSRHFLDQELPPETFSNRDQCNSIETGVVVERERLLQLLSLADEYEQTLKEFAQIIEVADNLVSSDVTITSLSHLQDEMQKHRKFFVNLSHCRGILESLEGNLDLETRGLHRELHERLHTRATAVLDAAAGRAQQMALAASRWTVLEQGVREQQQWLQVAHQRLPDLHQVTTSDHHQYISMYQVSPYLLLFFVQKNILFQL